MKPEPIQARILEPSHAVLLNTAAEWIRKSLRIHMGKDGDRTYRKGTTWCRECKAELAPRQFGDEDSRHLSTCPASKLIRALVLGSARKRCKG